MPTSSDLFTTHDLLLLSGLAIETWRSGIDRDWSVRAGTLDWSCRTTAEHTVDAVFAPAFFLASRREHAYPHFDVLRALPDATISDLVDGLRAVTTMLWAVIVTAEPGTQAIIRRRPAIETAAAQDFAPRGALELILHTYDISAGLGIPFEPPRDLCSRLLAHTAGWPGQVRVDPSGDSWSDLVARYGRPRPT
jgi:hypothetical protein